MASVFGMLIRQRLYRNTKRKKKKDSRKHMTRERMQRKVDRDDFLLAQIDEFREKAQELQEMLATKETKAKQLQDIVEEREVKAEELQQILDERQEKADGITAEVAKQIDVLIDRVNAKMVEIEQSMSQEVGNISRAMTSEMDNLSRSMTSEVNNLGRSLSADIQSIEQNFGGNIEETKRITEEGTAQVRAVVNQNNAQMLETLGQLNEQLETLKSDLSEKVHTENVKSFRNIQDLIRSMGEKMEQVSEVEQSVKSNRTFTMLVLVLSIVNTVGFLAFAMITMGII